MAIKWIRPQQILYVATTGEYSDYQVVGVFSTYEKAASAAGVESKKRGMFGGHEGVFTTILDDPDNAPEAHAALICVEPTTAYYSAPSGVYKDTSTSFSPGDIIHTWSQRGQSPESPPIRDGATIIAWGRTKQAAIRAAREAQSQYEYYRQR